MNSKRGTKRSRKINGIVISEKLVIHEEGPIQRGGRRLRNGYAESNSGKRRRTSSDTTPRSYNSTPDRPTSISNNNIRMLRTELREGFKTLSDDFSKTVSKEVKTLVSTVVKILKQQSKEQSKAQNRRDKKFTDFLEAQSKSQEKSYRRLRGFQGNRDGDESDE